MTRLTDTQGNNLHASFPKANTLVNELQSVLPLGRKVLYNLNNPNANEYDEYRGDRYWVGDEAGFQGLDWTTVPGLIVYVKMEATGVITSMSSYTELLDKAPMGQRAVLRTGPGPWCISIPPGVRGGEMIEIIGDDSPKTLCGVIVDFDPEGASKALRERKRKTSEAKLSNNVSKAVKTFSAEEAYSSSHHSRDFPYFLPRSARSLTQTASAPLLKDLSPEMQRVIASCARTDALQNYL